MSDAAEVFTSGDGQTACARRQAGTVLCMEDGAPVALPGWAGVERFAPGAVHACAVITGGTVECAGENANGQLGAPTPAQSATPIAVPGVANATGIASSATATCALIDDGTVTCWGRPTGEAADLPPTPVAGLTTATALAGSPTGFCATRAAADTVCWGSVRTREAPATTIDTTTPQALPGISGLPATGTGHWCVRLATAQASCWGLDGSGELGRGTVAPPPLPLTPVVDLAGAVQVAVADDHSCALTAAGTVACWGASGSGQLGAGATASRAAPTRVVDG